jgi:hypothetical protein
MRGQDALHDALHHRREGRGRHHLGHLAHQVGIGGDRRHLLLPEVHQPLGQVLDGRLRGGFGAGFLAVFCHGGNYNSLSALRKPGFPQRSDRIAKWGVNPAMLRCIQGVD